MLLADLVPGDYVLNGVNEDPDADKYFAAAVEAVRRDWSRETQIYSTFGSTPASASSLLARSWRSFARHVDRERRMTPGHSLWCYPAVTARSSWRDLTLRSGTVGR